MEGHDDCDSTSVGIEGGVELPSREDLKGVSFGVPKELAGEAEGIEPGVRESFEKTVALIEELGGDVPETELPHAPHGISAYYVIAPAEASANLARFDGVRYGTRADGAEDLTEMYERTRPRRLRATRSSAGSCSAPTRSPRATTRPTTGSAQKVRTRIAEDFSKAFERFDFIVTPTSPTVAFELGSRTDDPLAMYMSDYCTVPMPLAGFPRSRSPRASRKPDDGGPELPVGFQIAGPPSARAACSTPPTRSSGRSSSRARRDELGARDRTGDPRPALDTATKMFCGCGYRFGDEPNVHTCPVCLGAPGRAARRINAQAIRCALAVSRRAALGAEVPRAASFARKHYFYPDLPKGYQISQFDQPDLTGGGITPDGGRVGRLTRAHLEEDAAKLTHMGE